MSTGCGRLPGPALVGTLVTQEEQGCNMQGERRARGALLAEGLRVCASPEIAVTHSLCSVGRIPAKHPNPLVPASGQEAGSTLGSCLGTWAEQAGSGEQCHLNRKEEALTVPAEAATKPHSG